MLGYASGVKILVGANEQVSTHVGVLFAWIRSLRYAYDKGVDMLLLRIRVLHLKTLEMPSPIRLFLGTILHQHQH